MSDTRAVDTTTYLSEQNHKLRAVIWQLLWAIKADAPIDRADHIKTAVSLMLEDEQYPER